MANHLKISKGRKKSFLKVPVGFLDYYLPTVNGDYLKVYLYGIRLCCDNKSLTDDEIAEKLGILKADVKNAWNFWEQEGLITIFDDGTIEFENLEELTFLSTKVNKPVKKEQNFNEILDTVGMNAEFKNVIRTIEALYKEFLTQNDVILIYDVVITQNIPLELFVITMTHCIEKNKKNIAYIAKVVTECYKKGYTTSEALEEYFSKSDENGKYFRNIKKILKIYSRELIEKEKEYILKWRDCGKSDEEIKAAFECTVLNTGKLSFPYMDKVLMGGASKKEKLPRENTSKPGPLNNFRDTQMPDFGKLTDQLMKKQGISFVKED